MSPKERQVEVNEMPTRVVDSARRGLLPILAVHGFPGADLMTLHGTPGFENLGVRTRVIFYDQRGAGQSGGWGEGVAPGLEQHAADLLGLIGTLNLDRPILIGHHHGGDIALELALKQPAAISGLVLVCSPAGASGHDRTAFEAKLADMLEGVDLPALLEAGESDPDIALRGAMEEIFPLGFLRFGLNERTFAKRVTFRRSAYDDCWAAVSGGDRGARLPELRVPTLVVAGRYDPFIDLSKARETAAAIPGARFMLMHSAAHWPFLEEPDRFADEIWTWIEEVAAHIV